MTDELLASFVDAYRAEHSARALDRRALRARVVAAAARPRVRRAERLRLLVPFAASFVATAALAASPPLREHVLGAFSFVRIGEAARVLPRPPHPATGGPAAPAAPVPAPVAVPAAPAGVEPPPRVPGAPSQEPLRPKAAPAAGAAPRAPSGAAHAAVPRAGAGGASSTPSASFAVEPVSAGHEERLPPSTNADLALYRRAHELHFGGADEARTLAAWEAYLRAFPRGTFAPEARLNRAVCLAKLGRKAEAERVLVDIERGRFGKDGRRQARKILGALGGED